MSRVTDFERLFRDWPDFNEPIGELRRGCHAFNQNITDCDVRRREGHEPHVPRRALVRLAHRKLGRVERDDDARHVLGLSRIQLADLRDMTRMFSASLHGWDRALSAWSAPAAISMREMFRRATAMNRPVMMRDTSQLQSTARMFFDAWAFNSSLVLIGDVRRRVRASQDSASRHVARDAGPHGMTAPTRHTRA